MYQSMGPLAAFVLALGILGYIVQSRLPPPKPKIIGIDLGTTFSCVATYNAVYGNVTVLEDEEGNRVIPSVVAFMNDRVLVGYSATKQAEQNPARTVYDAKRFIGKIYRNGGVDQLNKIRKIYPFEIQLDDGGTPKFGIDSEDGRKVTYQSPDDIGAIILRTLKATAEKRLGSKVSKAVVSVPAEFDELQRDATILAGKKAGLDVLRVINEPTAAAMAYGLHNKSGSNLIIVIDFGGGTLDVSLLNVQGGMFVTMAMAGNNRLGGQDINENLVDYFQNELQHIEGCTVTHAEDLQHLRDEVERAKITLTFEDSTDVSVKLRHASKCKSTFESKDVYKNLHISRETFELLNKDIFKKILVPIQKVLSEADVEKSDVDEVILVGGSTRVPKVRELVSTYFGKNPNIEIDPDIAVVTGVAVQAGILGGAWPLQVSAIEVPRNDLKKIDVSNDG